MRSPCISFIISMSSRNNNNSTLPLQIHAPPCFIASSDGNNFLWLYCSASCKPTSCCDFGWMCLKIGSIDFLEIMTKKCFPCSSNHFEAKINVFGTQAYLAYKFVELAGRKVHRVSTLPLGIESRDPLHQSQRP